MRKIAYKDRRKVRRQNHIAKDLRTPKYRQQIIDSFDKQKYRYKKWIEQDHDEETTTP